MFFKKEAAFYQGLHCLPTKRFIEIKIKMKNTTSQSLKQILTGPMERMVNSGRFKWVKKGIMKSADGKQYLKYSKFSFCEVYPTTYLPKLIF